MSCQSTPKTTENSVFCSLLQIVRLNEETIIQVVLNDREAAKSIISNNKAIDTHC
jgi:hypothetical protein